MKTNNWGICQDSLLEWIFDFENTFNNRQFILYLIKTITDAGRRYEVMSILNTKNQQDNQEKLEKDISIALGNSPIINVEENDLLLHLFPDFEGESEYRAFYKLAYYKNGQIEIRYIHHIQELYDSLPQTMLRNYHYLETGVYCPLKVELSILNNKTFRLRIASGLEIWLPRFNIIALSNSSTTSVNNLELYYLNTPRLAGFINEIEKFFITNNIKVQYSFPSKLNAHVPFIFYSDNNHLNNLFIESTTPGE